MSTRNAPPDKRRKLDHGGPPKEGGPEVKQLGSSSGFSVLPSRQHGKRISMSPCSPTIVPRSSPKSKATLSNKPVKTMPKIHIPGVSPASHLPRSNGPRVPGLPLQSRPVIRPPGLSPRGSLSGAANTSLPSSLASRIGAGNATKGSLRPPRQPPPFRPGYAPGPVPARGVPAAFRAPSKQAAPRKAAQALTPRPAVTTPRGFPPLVRRSLPTRAVRSAASVSAPSDRHGRPPMKFGVPIKAQGVHMRPPSLNPKFPASSGSQPGKKGDASRPAPKNTPRSRMFCGVAQPTKLRPTIRPIMARPRFGPIRPVRPHAKRAVSVDPYGLESYTKEDMDFIDDGNEETEDWKEQLRSVTGYDPTVFNDCGECSVSNHREIEEEEFLSETIARKEDMEELKRIQQEYDEEIRRKRKRKYVDTDAEESE